MRWIVVGSDDASVVLVDVDADGREIARQSCDVSEFPRAVARRESVQPRWVWSDSPRWYEQLLAAGVRVQRAHDLRLVRALLRWSGADGDPLVSTVWDAAPVTDEPAAPALFELDDAHQGVPDSITAALAAFATQREALAGGNDRMRLLAAAESAGALVAVEMRAAGLPWDEVAHDGILRGVLGQRPAAGGLPSRLVEAGERVRAALGDPGLSLDSPPKVLRALHRVGVGAASTSRWELAEYNHPAIAPLMEYKKLARLLSANGWAWLEQWVTDGRFRPVYIPGGVVTGRWASAGGGALQIPRLLRGAVRADPGWTFVIADVAQLEPRALAAMASDMSLADAARGTDLYAGIVERGAVATRDEAKIAMLGAMYGATTGESGRLLPRLRRTFPRSMALVDEAARAGEDGATVSTWLGRTSPPPEEAWRRAQAAASEADSDDATRDRARRWARDRGRFTRNFVVQGTAAEWALAWLADLRVRLASIDPVSSEDLAPRAGAAFQAHPHLAFFLHDEVIVHTPMVHAEAVATMVQESAARAASILFGTFPLDFPLDVHIATTAEKS